MPDLRDLPQAHRWNTGSGAAASAPAGDPRLRPPVAEPRPRAFRVHDHELVDPYHWLRNRNDPEVLPYLEAENAYAEAMMAPARPLREALYRELVGHVHETDVSAPYRRGRFLYYARTEAGCPYPIHCRRPVASEDEGAEEVILDVNALAEGRAYLRVGHLAVSPSQRFLAFSTDTSGRERFSLRVKDLSTGRLLADEIDGLAYSLAWANDDRTLFYVARDAAERPFEVRRHTLGTDPGGDPVVYREADERFLVSVSRTRSDSLVLVASHSATTSEVRWLSAATPAAEPRLLLPRRDGVEYFVAHHPEAFYLRTSDGAEEFRLLRVPVDPLGVPLERERWEEVLPPRSGVKLEWVQVFLRHLVVAERSEGVLRLRVIRIADGAQHEIPLPEALYAVAPAENPELDSEEYRFSYTSPVTPWTVYDYHLERRTLEVRKRQEVPGYDPGRYETARVFARAEDGTAIPITLVHRRGLPRDGSSPAFLYGYGSYGTSLDPEFSAGRLPLLDRGFVYAIAHVRGGGIHGEAWHDAGRVLAKRTSFTDFISAAEHLVAQGYTASDRLAIAGGSAGGLLIGAVLNLRPELFRAALAQVPFVDVLNTMLDASVPLTVTEFEEWGDPREEEHFAYMRSYSPYDNVKPQAYPHLLITAGLHDSRVQYWEPAKWAARLRATKTDDNLLLLKTDMEAGHSGASGRYAALAETAFEYAFVLSALGLAG